MTTHLASISIDGIPCKVEFSYAGAEPDVGLQAGVDDIVIRAIGKRPIKHSRHAAWLYAKLNRPSVWDRAAEQCLQARRESCYEG